MGSLDTPLSIYVILSFTFLFMQTLVSVSAFSGYTNMTCLESERRALVTFKHSLVDESNLLSSWTGDDCCAWHGVQCHRRTRHIFKLDLHNPADFLAIGNWNYEISCLRGKISNSLQNLKNLTYLDLSMNDFLGSQILKFFYSFKNLRYLNLSYSKLRSEIPLDPGRLSSLQYLDLHYNDFNGSFPTEIRNLAQLRHLDISFNKFQGLILAQIFYNLTQIEIFDVSANNFSGSVPIEIFGNLTHIRKLHLSNNNFIGNLPPVVQGLNFLEELHISNNKLSDIFPAWPGQLSKLQSLDLYVNLMVGTISEDHMKNLTSLKHFQLSSNVDLVVNVSSTWTAPFQLNYLNLSSCKVGPPFPQWLRNQRELENLAISNGSIKDTIPDWFENVYSSVKFLDLSHNQITGNLFENVSGSHIVNLDLSYNQLSGNVIITSEMEQLSLSNNLPSGLMVSNDINIGNWSLVNLFPPK